MPAESRFLPSVGMTTKDAPSSFRDNLNIFVIRGDLDVVVIPQRRSREESAVAGSVGGASDSRSLTGKMRRFGMTRFFAVGG
jgi:hypothetical protein